MRRWMHVFIELAPAVAALVVVLVHPWRGLSLWGLWLLEHTERVAAWAASPSDELARAAFEGGAGLMPLPAMMAAWFSAPGGELVALRALGAFAAAALVWAATAWGRELGGRTAGVAAGLLMLCMPRLYAAATAVSPTVFTAASIAVMSLTWFRARRSARWLAAAFPATVVALGCSVYGWMALVPALSVFYLEPSRRPFRGEVNVRPATPLALVLPIAAVFALVTIVPWWQDDTAARLGSQLRWWLERPAEPVLLGGTLYGPRRIPLWAPALLSVYTLPFVIVVSAVCGLVWRSLRRPGPARAGVVTWLLFALLLPVVLRSVWHGGNDLMVLSLPWIAAAAGACVASSARWVGRATGRGAPATAAALAVVLVCAAVPVVRSAGHYEAWYSGVIGGTEGAVMRGYSRGAHAPVPPAIANVLRDTGATRVAVVANAWEVAPVLYRYGALGLLPGPVEVTPVASAELVVAVFDDALPELYGVARDVHWLAQDAGARAWRWSAPDGTPLVVAAPVR